MSIDWKKKLTSRKFWAAVAGFVAGLLVAFGREETAETVAALIMSGASVVAYIIGEGLIDAAAAGSVEEELPPAIGFEYESEGGEDE